MSQTGKIIIGVLLAICIFVAGVFITLPKVAAKKPIASETLIAGKPTQVMSRRTPAVEETPAALPLAQHTPQFTSDKDSAWIFSESTPVHDGPGLDHPVFITLKYGRRVQLLDTQEGWRKIGFDGQTTGWVQTQFVVTDRPANIPIEGPEEAIKTLNAFYADIAKHRLGPAYDRLSFEFKRSLSYAQFEKGYAEVEAADVRVLRTQQLGPERYSLSAELMITEPKAVKGYRGEFVATLEKATWKLSQGSLEVVDIEKMAPFAATANGTVDKPAFPDPTPTPGDEDDNNP